MTPIAVPLRDGLVARDLEDRDAAVAFDADGSGLNRPWTWVTKDAGWLVYDPKGRGEITSGLQLFGNVTFWLFWENGYHALASLDDDGDGELTGDELKGLAIWHDAGHLGVCDPGEVKPLSAYGIVAVSCRFEPRRESPGPDRVLIEGRDLPGRQDATDVRPHPGSRQPSGTEPASTGIAERSRHRPRRSVRAVNESRRPPDSRRSATRHLELLEQPGHRASES